MPFFLSVSFSFSLSLSRALSWMVACPSRKLLQKHPVDINCAPKGTNDFAIGMFPTQNIQLQSLIHHKVGGMPVNSLGSLNNDTWAFKTVQLPLRGKTISCHRPCI